MQYNHNQKAEALAQQYKDITKGFSIDEVNKILREHSRIYPVPQNYHTTENELTELFNRHRIIKQGQELVKSQNILIHYIYKNSATAVKLIFTPKLSGSYVVRMYPPKIGAFITFKKEDQIYFGWSLCMKSDIFNRHFAIAQAYSRAEILIGPPKVPSSIKNDLKVALVRFERYWKTNLTSCLEP